MHRSGHLKFTIEYQQLLQTSILLNTITPLQLYLCLLALFPRQLFLYMQQLLDNFFLLPLLLLDSIPTIRSTPPLILCRLKGSSMEKLVLSKLPRSRIEQLDSMIRHISKYQGVVTEKRLLLTWPD
jgi:hypothetical protein